MLGLLAISDDHRRNRVNDLLIGLGMETMQIPDYPAAKITLQQCPYPANAFICDLTAEKDAVEKCQAWRDVKRKAKNRGYFLTQKCFLIVDDKSEGFAKHFAGPDVEIISTRDAGFSKLIRFVEQLRERPILTFTHIGASPFDSEECVSGEVIAPITLQLTADAAPAPLDLFRFARIVVDATSKYATKYQPQDNRSMLGLMSADPVYSWLLEDRSLTIRNYITAWSLFGKQLLQTGDNRARSIAGSTKAGRETFYFVDAECEVVHIKNAPR
jgi:hypothetical protein